MTSGKNAVVTGSTSGIGEGIARDFAKAGMNVMLNGFGDENEIETLRRELESDCGVRVLYSPADLTKPAAIREMIAQAKDGLGSVDILVNNAGIQYVSPIEDFPEEKWDTIIALNMSASFHTIKAVFGDMKDKGWGRIINIASAHALTASPFKCAYVTAKHGILGLTRTVALEGAQFGVTANAICPAYVHTPLVDKQIPDTAKARGMTEEEVVTEVILAAQPTKKFVKVEEVAALATYLCSDAAASITGVPLSVDGGWTAQ